METRNTAKCCWSFFFYTFVFLFWHWSIEFFWRGDFFPVHSAKQIKSIFWNEIMEILWRKEKRLKALSVFFGVWVFRASLFELIFRAFRRFWWILWPEWIHKFINIYKYWFSLFAYVSWRIINEELLCGGNFGAIVGRVRMTSFITFLEIILRSIIVFLNITTT